MMNVRVTTPKRSGITTNKTVDKINVLIGTATFPTPNKIATIGAYNTKIIKSLIAT